MGNDPTRGQRTEQPDEPDDLDGLDVEVVEDLEVDEEAGDVAGGTDQWAGHPRATNERWCSL